MAHRRSVVLGLIVALSFTCSIGAADAGRVDVRTMLGGAIGSTTAFIPGIQNRKPPARTMLLKNPPPRKNPSRPFPEDVASVQAGRGGKDFFPPLTIASLLLEY